MGNYLWRNYGSDSGDGGMYRKGNNKLWKNSGGGTYVPAALRERYDRNRASRHAAPTSSLSIDLGPRSYGPPRRRPRRSARENKLRERLFKDLVEEWKKRQEKKLKELEEKRLKEEELKNLEALTVETLDLNIRGNALKHHTELYEITKDKEDPHAVLRRGQEFEVTVTFNRPYHKDQDDLIFILDGDEEDDSPMKNLKERFLLEEEGDGSDTYKKDGEFGARIVKTEDDQKTMRLAIYIPPDCVVGEWELRVKTKLRGEVNKDYVYEHNQDIFILFNPWCKEDTVYFDEDPGDVGVEFAGLGEYVLNQNGTVYSGCGTRPGSRPWKYGQFQKGILDICMTVMRQGFGCQVKPAQRDPVEVARALSRIVNSSDDNGVLVGNWSGDYEGGERPTFWKNSTDILRRYQETGDAVRFGQCWVFSHVLTTVCRALGLPCRSVTNFDSAHDTDNTCTIDRYQNEDGDELNGMKSDSIWNFHVWNEVWIKRPDLCSKGTYDGWHALDATPQEQSHGVYQCGPSPVAAVKRGDIQVGYDTLFVFGEVNADIIHWCVEANGDINKASNVLHDGVGNIISTKPPDGKEHTGGLAFWNYKTDKTKRYDLTSQYKFADGTEEERAAVRRAVSFTRHGRKLYKESRDLKVTFDTENCEFSVGETATVRVFVENVTGEDKEVSMLMAARACRYWDHSNGTATITDTTYPPRTIKAGQKEEFTLDVPPEKYLKTCDEQLSFFTYACAKDVAARMPYSSQETFRFVRPDLEIETNSNCVKSKEKITARVTMANPLPTPLTNCSWQMNGDLYFHDDDKNDKDEFFFNFVISAEDIPAGGSATLELVLYGEVEEDEESRCMTMDINFNCEGLESGAKGAVSVTVTK